ncbi:MAG TPA: cytochrome C [Chryseolinea sp.]
MKKLPKVIGFVLLGIALLIGILISYIKLALPDVGEPEEITVELTPERIERGKYLAHSVSLCMDCHATRDWSKFSGPPTEGTLGKGGDRFDQTVGLPGVYYAKNITPFGIKRYTDGELFRVITTGVTKEGKAMFPLMPYLSYGKMDREDIYDIIAYIRSLSPIESTIPESVSDFPMSIIINTLPQKAELQKKPDPADQLAYGAYMVNASGCVECHTQVDKGQIIRELSFSGGREFSFPNGAVVRSSNITQDLETGIGKWSQAQFVQRFKQYADSSFVIPSVRPDEFNSIMPWTMYAHMKESDLTAIYAYLKTVKAIPNNVTKFSPPSQAVSVSSD